MLLVLSLICPVLAYFPFQAPVVEGTTENWVEEVSAISKTQVVVALFLQNRSSQCKAVVPHFQEAANQQEGMVKYMAIDFKANPKVGHLYTVRAVPAIRIIHPKGVEEYGGEMNTQNIVNAAQKLMPNYCSNIDSTWLPSPNTSLKAIYFTNKKSLPAFWLAISSQYAGTNVSIGYTRNSQLFRQFDVAEPNTVIFIANETVSVYSGQLAYKPVEEALRSFVISPQSSGVVTSVVNSLSGKEEFEQHCKNSGKICVISRQMQEKEAFEEVAKVNKFGSFRFFVNDEEGVTDGISRGFWFFHPKRNRAIHAKSIEELKSVIDQIIGGSGKWKNVEEL